MNLLALRVRLLVIFFTFPSAFADEAENYIQNLADENYIIREDAAYSLGKFNDTRVVNPLINALNDRISDVRKAAAFSLGEINNTSAVDPLIKRLGKEADDNCRGDIAIALGKIRDPRAVDPLIQQLNKGNMAGSFRSDSDSGIIEALGELGDPKAIDTLSKFLYTKSIGDRSRPSKAAEALEKIAKRGNNQATDALIQALSNSNYYWVHDRVRIVEALGNVGDPRSVDILIKVSDGDAEDPDVREAAREALMKLPTL